LNKNAPGDVMFIDYAGKTLSYFEKSSGEAIKHQLYDGSTIVGM
jgi:hypothetical protein